MRRLQRKRLAALIFGLALLLTGLSPNRATADWTTKGGSTERRSVNDEPVGLMQVEPAWSVELGQSATQPVVVERTVYHLTMEGLWRIRLSPTGEIEEAPKRLGSPMPKPVNTWVNESTGEQVTLVSQSSPTYSPDSKMLYFGTAYGWLWAYHTEAGWFRFEEIQLGCPIVGSPLVLRDQQQEIVVVATRPFFPGEASFPQGRPHCDQANGKVWRVIGLDRPAGEADKRPYEAPPTKDDPGGFGGFITPAAVPGPDATDGPTFIIGTDGFAGGRAIRLVLDRGDGYRLKHDWVQDGGAGFAGTLSADGAHAYWLDTAGSLWGASLRDGNKPSAWPAQSIDLASLIGAPAAFTNTEPAVEIRPDGTHLYITLRNQGRADLLRAGETGSHGAVVAIGPDGRLKWQHKFDRPDGAGRPTSINTAPLAITTSNVMLFGDVNGFFYAYALHSANPDGGHVQPFLVPRPGELPTGEMFLLKQGETPARGRYSFSQVSGVGVDPAMAAGLILVGVNYEKDDAQEKDRGRLVAYRVGRAYNLAWQGSPEPLALRDGEATIIRHPVGYYHFAPAGTPTLTLGALCTETPDVSWYVTGPGGYIRKLWPEVDLPADQAHATSRESGMAILLNPADPAEGEIVAIIDLPGLMALAGEHGADPLVRLAQRIGTAVGEKPRIGCRGASEIINEPGGPPQSGLADNVLAIPYSRQRVLDDPYVLPLEAPKLVQGDRFKATAFLAYKTNTGAESVAVAFRCWARLLPHGSSPGPDDFWRPATIQRAGTDKPEDCTFTEMDEGTWEVVAEIAYDKDTDPSNNRRTIQVKVIAPPPPSDPGDGSSLGG